MFPFALGTGEFIHISNSQTLGLGASFIEAVELFVVS